MGVGPSMMSMNPMPVSLWVLSRALTLAIPLFSPHHTKRPAYNHVLRRILRQSATKSHVNSHCFICFACFLSRCAEHSGQHTDAAKSSQPVISSPPSTARTLARIKGFIANR